MRRDRVRVPGLGRPSPRRSPPRPSRPVPSPPLKSGLAQPRSTRPSASAVAWLPLNCSTNACWVASSAASQLVTGGLEVERGGWGSGRGGGRCGLGGCHGGDHGLGRGRRSAQARPITVNSSVVFNWPPPECVCERRLGARGCGSVVTAERRQAERAGGCRTGRYATGRAALRAATARGHQRDHRERQEPRASRQARVLRRAEVAVAGLPILASAFGSFGGAIIVDSLVRGHGVPYTPRSVTGDQSASADTPVGHAAIPHDPVRHRRRQESVFQMPSVIAWTTVRSAARDDIFL